MAEGMILQDAKTYVSIYDISGDLNQINLQTPYDVLDGTAFGATSRRRQVGLDAINLELNGFTAFGSTAIDKILSGLNGQGSLPLTIIPAGATEGNRALFFKSTQTKYAMGSEVGQLHQFSATFKGAGHALIAGFLSASGIKTVTGNGANKNLGTVGATQFLYAILHVFAASGTTPTLDAIVESDDSGAFSSPTTRITFTQVTTTPIAYYATRVAGPITDNFFRMKFTIAGTTPSYTIAGAIGIF